MSNGQVDVMHNRAIKLRVSSVINIFSQNVSEPLVSPTTEDKNIILNAYSTQKVGSGGNFESGIKVTRQTANTNSRFNSVNTRKTLISF